MNLARFLLLILVLCPSIAMAAEKAIKVKISGEVYRPGVVEIADGTKFSDAIRKAGGFTRLARRSAVEIRRKEKDQEVRVEKTITELTGDKPAFPLCDGDTIVVLPRLKASDR